MLLQKDIHFVLSKDSQMFIFPCIKNRKTFFLLISFKFQYMNVTTWIFEHTHSCRLAWQGKYEVTQITIVGPDQRQNVVQYYTNEGLGEHSYKCTCVRSNNKNAQYIWSTTNSETGTLWCTSGEHYLSTRQSLRRSDRKSQNEFN